MFIINRNGKSILKMRVHLVTKRLFNEIYDKVVLQKRFRSDINQGKNVRVRFAPSPTGNLHLGGLRTALYNYLFAKSTNGTSILRIEDTDLARKVEGSAEKLIEDLEWCGIRFDEGPYYQSANRQIYEDYAKLLVDKGKAYYCFCSETRLNLLRKSLIKSGEVMKYDNKCRKLTKDEVESKLRNNESCVIRFKLTDSIVDFNDIIFGYYHFNVMENEGDPVILKSDGYPTYHLANVVDDHEMKITHVFRGSEWLISTIKHLLIFKAFNWESPQYGHLPLLLNNDGTKFSKRDKSLNVCSFRQEGIFPNALINFVTRTGGGINIKINERENKSFSMEDFIQKFDINTVHKNSCTIEMNRLLDDNRNEMKRMLNDEKDVKILIESVRSCMRKHFETEESSHELSDDFILNLLNILIDRINKVDDIFKKSYSYLWYRKKYKFIEEGDFTINKMKELINQLSRINWNPNAISETFRSFAENHSVKYSSFMRTVRLTLTDSKEGLPVAQIMILLGKENSIQRLKDSMES